MLIVDARIVALRFVGVAREMLLHPCFRAEETLFLAAPESKPDGAARPRADGLEDAHGFHHGGDAIGIVGRAHAGVPGIDVGAEHDDLILQDGIGAGNFRDDVVRVGTAS